MNFSYGILCVEMFHLQWINCRVSTYGEILESVNLQVVNTHVSYMPEAFYAVLF